MDGEDRLLDRMSEGTIPKEIGEELGRLPLASKLPG